MKNDECPASRLLQTLRDVNIAAGHQPSLRFRRFAMARQADPRSGVDSEAATVLPLAGLQGFLGFRGI